MKKNFKNNESGVAPIIWVGLIAVTAIAGVWGYSYFQQPDVTYNISEGGLFSIAGLEIGGLELVAIVVGVLILVAWLFQSMRKK